LDRAKSREVHPTCVRRLAAARVIWWFGNEAGLKKQKGKTMLKKLLGAAAMAATAYAFVPAYAAHVHHASVGCSGDNFAKAEGEVETMADGPGKFMAEKEIALAQDAMLSGKMSGCAMHLGQALRDERMAQAPGTVAPAPFANPVVPAAAETTQQTWSQPQWGWEPLPSPK
jgi:hypothetical protein